MPRQHRLTPPPLPWRRLLLAGSLTAAALSATLLAPLRSRAATPPPLSRGGDAPPQVLPITAQWCLRPATCIALEVPHGDRQFSWGLQLRPPLPPLRGMWFGFSEPTPARFWMHRTPHPLDMLFVRQGRVIAIEPRVPPCMHLPCRSYGTGEPVDGVMELGAGEADRLQIHVGTGVTISPLTPAGPRTPAQPGRGPAAPAPG